MGRLFHELGIADLAGLEYLATDRTVRLTYQERTAAGLARVLHYAADADGPVQLSALLVAQIRVLECLEDAFLLRYQHTCEDLFVTDSVFLQFVGHYVVDILNEDDVGVLLVQVLYQRAVTARTEEQLAVLRAERSTVRISGDGVGGRQLFAESHVVLHAVLVLELLEVVGNVLTEERQVVMAHREMQIDSRFLAVLCRLRAV